MRFKTLIAIILIIVSLAGMYYWESCGREAFLMSEVLVSASDIPAGKRIDLTDLSVNTLPSSTLPQNSLSINDAGSLVGMTAAVDIPGGIQLASSYFTSAGQSFTRGQSIYVIPASWICEVSNSVRAGDEISIFLMPEFRYLGCYRVAFAKDDSFDEIADEGAPEILERSVAQELSELEIICSLGEYKRIARALSEEIESDNGYTEYESDGAACHSLLIVQNIEI